MQTFDEKNATADELWDYYQEEYKNPNPIVKILLDGYYEKVSQIVSRFRPDFRLLEVGCATGESSRRIGMLLQGQEFEVSEYDHRLVGKMLETGFPFPVRQESVYSLQREDDSFDCVFFLEVLEHIEDVPAALSELMRVTRKYLVISVPNEPLWSILNMIRGKYWNDGGNTPGHINRWSPRAFQQLLGNYGTVVATYRPLPWTILLVEKHAGRG
jgi:2-polyprenyl-3-methyl-5-hydroxy-6-metoxy-1,4-benzoquinol methylase